MLFSLGVKHWNTDCRRGVGNSKINKLKVQEKKKRKHGWNISHN